MGEDPFRCPECGSLAVSVEMSGMVVQDQEGRELVDEMTFDVSPDGYAECRSCGHSGIAEDFGS